MNEEIQAEMPMSEPEMPRTLRANIATSRPRRNFGLEVEKISNGYLVMSMIRGKIFCKDIKEVKKIVSEKIEDHYKSDWTEEGESV